MATRYPSEFTSVILDGMDQAKTSIPTRVTMLKNAQPLKTHLEAAMVRSLVKRGGGEGERKSDIHFVTCIDPP